MKKAFLFAAAVLALLCGCGAAGNSGGTDLPRLVIGSDTYEPFTYPSPDGSMAGIDVELAAEACRRMGYEPEFRQIVWENKDDYLESGEVDCLWGCFTMSGREALYQWAGPYLYSRQAVAVRRDSGIVSLAQLDGLRVAVQASSKPESLLLRGGDGVPDVGAVYCFSTMEEIYACLRKGYADAAAGHETALASFVKEAPEDYRILDEALYLSQIGVAFRAGTHAALAAELTETLDEMAADGTTRAIVERYGLDADRMLEGPNGAE